MIDKSKTYVWRDRRLHNLVQAMDRQLLYLNGLDDDACHDACKSINRLALEIVRLFDATDDRCDR